MLLPPGCDALAERDCLRHPIQFGLNSPADSILLGNAALPGKLGHKLRRCVVLDVKRHREPPRLENSNIQH